MNWKRLLIVTLLLFLQFQTQGQAKLISLGYNLGRFVTPQRNFEVLAYETNLIQPGLDFNTFLRGASLGIQLHGEERFFLEFLFTNKKNKSSLFEYYNVGRGADYKYQIKSRLRTLNIGMAMGSQFIKCGVSFDAGLFKILNKHVPSDEFSSAKWERFYQSNSSFIGFTLFVPIQLVVVEFRPYFQAAFFYDDFLAGRSATHKSSNFGINMSILLGKYD